MNSYDTLKIAFPVHLLGMTDRERKRSFDTRISDLEKGSSRKMTLKPSLVKPVLGLSSLEIQDQKAVLEISAKSLHRDYYDGITKDNITTALQNTIPEFIECDYLEIVERSSVMRCDVVRNVPCTNVEFTLAELGAYPIEPHTNRAPYLRARIETVSWQSTRITRNMRLSAYDKTTEANRKRDRSLWERLDIDRFKDHIRVEANLRKHADIKAMHGMDEVAKGIAPYLNEVLLSRHNALGNVMDFFLRPELEPNEPHTYLDGVEGVKEEGYLSIFKRFSWNWDMSRAYILAGYSKKSNPTRMLKQVRQLFNDHNPNGNPKTITEYQRVRTAIEEPFSGRGS